jgi:inner membrane transporter RhtA
VAFNQRVRDRAARVPPPALVLGGVVGLEGGAVVAATVIPVAGIAGTVMLRLGFGALGLIALRRPSVRGLDRRAVLLTIAVGLLLAAHHLCFYLAIHRLPLGVAVTLEFAGPLIVVLAGTQRRTDLLWALLAAAGVAGAAGVASRGQISLIGIAAGLGAGACWAGYIVVFPRLASHRGRGDGLALATGCAAVVTVPFWLASNPDRIFTPRALVLGAVVALLSDVLSYSLQSEALGRMPGSLFSILTSTEPAVGALFGLVALGQRIGPWQWAGMLAVVAASIGATATRPPQAEVPPPG